LEPTTFKPTAERRGLLSVAAPQLFSQGGEDGIQLSAFDVGGGSGNDVSGDAAQNVGLDRRKFWRQFRDEIARDGGKSVSVVKTEWGQPMTFQADFERLGQGEFLGLIFLPKSFGGQMSVGSGFVQGILLLAKTAIDFNDNFPVE